MQSTQTCLGPVFGCWLQPLRSPEGVAAKKGNNHDATKKHKRERRATAAAAAIAPVFISGLWHFFFFLTPVPFVRSSSVPEEADSCNNCVC